MKLVNAHRVKILPGPESEVLDTEWLAELASTWRARVAAGRFRGAAGDCGT